MGEGKQRKRKWGRIDGERSWVEKQGLKKRENKWEERLKQVDKPNVNNGTKPLN